MKSRKLPFGLLLIFTVLGGMALSFFSVNDGPRYQPREAKSLLENRLGKPATAFLAKIRNNQHTGVINPADIKRQNEEMGKIESLRAIDMEWMQMGPDNFGGRTRAILCTEDDGMTLVYAAGVTGGIWKSTNVGTTWNKINIGGENLNVSCMVKTANNNILVGTGESFDAQTVSGLEEIGYTSGFMGQGIYKSTNGEDFSLIEATKPEFNNMESDWAFVNGLAVNMSNNRIFASTNTGLKYSNDDGATWATAKDNDGNDLDMFSWDVKVGADGNVVADVNNLCYVSADGNPDNFVLKSTGDSLGLPKSGVNRIEFAIAPSDANVIYASVVDSTNNRYGVYLSEDAGDTWRSVLPNTNSINIFNDQGVYNNAITVFPDDPYRVLLGGIDSWQGNRVQENGFYDWRTISQSAFGPLFGPTYVHEDHHVYEFIPGLNNQFFVGTDGGIFLGAFSSSDGYTYQTSNRNYFTSQFYSVGPSGLKHYLVGGAQDIGTIKITGNGNTQKAGEQILTGEGGPSAISIVDKDYIIVTSTAGTLLRSDDGGANYSNVSQFPGDDFANGAFRTPLVLSENFTNENSSDTVTYFARDTIPGGTTIQVRSQNGGQPFPYKTPDVTLYPGDSLLIQDIVTSYLYVSTVDHIWLSTNVVRFDEEVEWFELSNTDFGFSGTPYSMALSANGNTMFVGTLEGRLFRFSNLATANTYERADVGSLSSIVSTAEMVLAVSGTSDTIKEQVITSVAIDPQDPNNVVVTLGNYGNDHYVLFTENALSPSPTFKSIQGNLPHMPIYSSVIEMSDPNIGILGTEMGVFITENIHAGSPQWAEASTDMGKVPVFQLCQQLVDQPARVVELQNGNEIDYIYYEGTNNFGSIYAATYGRGLFRNDNFFKVDIDEFFTEDDTKLTLKLYPNPVIDYATVEIEAEANKNLEVHVFDLNGRLLMSQTKRVQKGINKVSLDMRSFKKGTYIVRTMNGNTVQSQKFLVN
jgi:photosystem II stability/assembly factor-like uncharacterized protein